MRIETLTRMSGQIADNCSGLTDEQAVTRISDHLKAFWTPAMITELAEYDTESTDHLPDAETARKRRIRGKKPLYTYKVITITGKRRVSEVSKGGTHASPVAHLRRGHWRTYKSGVRGWVNAMMINGTDGIVVKDYKVEPRV